MPQHIRVFWGRMRGKVDLNFNWDAIGHESVVHISASEYVPLGRPPFTDESLKRHCGEAVVRVANIAPHGPPHDPNRGVTFSVIVDWNVWLPIVTDITVFDERPLIHYQWNAVFQ